MSNNTVDSRTPNRLVRRLAPLAALAALVGAPGGAAWPQSPVTAPAATPPRTHAADFSGEWIEKGTLDRTLESVRGTPPPPYRPEWMARYNEQVTKQARGEMIEPLSRLCWPPGMPTFNNFIYPVEILMTPGQVTLSAEYFQQTRRIFTDGRKHPSADDLDPSFQGHSIGHWEGKTLVVDTVGFRSDSYMRRPGFHSDQMHIIERISMVDPNTLKWVTSTEDPVALEKPWVVTRTMVRDDSLIREYVCAEETESRENEYPKTSDGGPATPAKPSAAKP